jgi:hypothetical protein
MIELKCAMCCSFLVIEELLYEKILVLVYFSLSLKMLCVVHF